MGLCIRIKKEMISAHYVVIYSHHWFLKKKKQTTSLNQLIPVVNVKWTVHMF